MVIYISRKISEIFCNLYSNYHYKLLYGLFFLFLNACAGTPQTDALYDSNYNIRYPAIELTQTAFFPQQKYQCGPAALATVLNDSGITVEPKQLTPLVYIPEKKGSLQIELIAATRRFGRIPYLIQPQLQDLLNEVKAGKPVLVFQNLGLNWYPQWHYAVVVGFDLVKNEIILRSGVEKQHRVNVALFERTWARAGYWALRILKPGEFPVAVDELRYLKALVSLERLNKWSELIISYRRAIKKWPNNKNFHMGLANSYYSSMQLVQAKKHYSQIIAQWSKYAPAYNNLAQVYLDTNDFANALKYVKKAIALAGRHQKIYQTTLSEIQSKLDE
ncbi:MAG: PA2778 family cysteine peptidase [Thiohalomonadales bacterium]